MTYAVASAPLNEGKDAVVYTAAESTASAVVSVIPDGSVGVMIDNDALITKSVTTYNKLHQMRDLFNEDSGNLSGLVAGISAGVNGTRETLKPDFVSVLLADNTSSALTAAMGTGEFCLIVSGAVRGTELLYSACIRAIDTILEQYFN